eukprot:SAG25_NODE_6461_length_558_cov_0.590414_1_plen_135_part_10
MLTSIGIVSSNANDTTRANVDDTITITVIASEPLVRPQVIIAGQTAAVVGFGAAAATAPSGTAHSRYTASYTVAAGEVNEGTVWFTVTYSDLSSNAGIMQTMATDGSAVSIDMQAPTLTHVHVESDNPSDPERAN